MLLYLTDATYKYIVCLHHATLAFIKIADRKDILNSTEIQLTITALISIMCFITLFKNTPFLHEIKY